MKLFYSSTSPFARKALVLAHETGLIRSIALEAVTVTPTEANAALAQAGNPLMKIPTMLLDDGEALFDSPVIVEYLDTLAGGNFIPKSGMARWRALRIQALADGVIEAAVAIRYEVSLRPTALQWRDWIAGQQLKMRQGFAALDAETTLGTGVTIAEIATACALGYIDFRFPDENWRTERPRLAAFYESFASRPSMRATVPTINPPVSTQASAQASNQTPTK